MLVLLLSTYLTASPLILIQTRSFEQTKELFADRNLTIHFYSDDFAIATALYDYPGNHHVLVRSAFEDPLELYYLLWLGRENTGEYLEDIAKTANILFRTSDFAIVSTRASNALSLYPAIHGGMVRLSSREAKLPSDSFNYGRAVLSARADIEAMLAEVDQDTLQAFVQHLEDYGTRNAYTSQSVEAQNWIYGKFASYGLNVELHDFSMPSGAASDNVVATLTGTIYPDEYVVLGAHYDSYASGGIAPGADDNATGTAGILEAARIMSQYSFDRSIIFATWSGEEYGLYGSDAWATEAASESMNILGYFNMDMAGYLQPGAEIHTDIIAPASANELRQFYKDVCATYLPDFEVYDGALSGGDSDHTSFNQNGYMGIFPFEDSQNYSPYIHSANDLIGPSVNSFEMHATFTKAIIANVATMADRLPMPSDLSATAGDSEVELTWTGVEEADYYNIYRDEYSMPFGQSSSTAYMDSDVINGTAYSYVVTAVFTGTGEESEPSNEVTAIPMPPIALPFFDDYETGGPYWNFESAWGLTEGTYYSSVHSMTESPVGNYTANMNASATLRALDFTGAATAQISFWTRYRIESGYDYMYLEVTTNGTEWNLLDSYTGNQLNWAQKNYSLNNYINEPNVVIRFRFYSDTYVQDQGMNIDDIEINIDGVGIKEPFPSKLFNLQARPNPADATVVVSFTMETESNVRMAIMNPLGQVVKELGEQHFSTGPHSLEMDVSSLSGGNYILLVEAGTVRESYKLVIRH